jgi:hypothetical protein
MAIAEAAMSKNPKNPGHALHEITKEQVRKKLRVSNTDLEKIEKAEIVNFVLDILDEDSAVPLCRNSKLVSADRSAGVFVSRAGLTYSDALLKCTQNTLNPRRIQSLIEHPDFLSSDEECRIVSTCERNHEQLALDRAATQLKLVQDKIATLKRV